jgi:DNA-binding transcriptional ArsR family regulator
VTKPVSPRLCRSVVEASELLKLVANPNRLAIVCFLLEEESAVARLEQELGIRQPTLSQQLTELRDCGVIEGHRDGKSIVYRVVDPRMARLVGTLRDLFAGLDDVTSRRAGHAMADLPIDEMMFD